MNPRSAFVFTVFLASALAQPASEVLLTVGDTHTLDVACAIRRVANGNKKAIKVRALGPQRLLVTAKKVGRGEVRVWCEDHEASYEIQVGDWLRKRTQKFPSSVVRVHVDFVELSESLSRDMGMHWPEWLRFRGRGTQMLGAATSGLNFATSFHTAEGFLSAMEKEGWAKILARPQMAVRLGEQAEFHSGGEFPVVTSAGGYGQVHRKVQWKPYGLSVKIKPEAMSAPLLDASIDISLSERSGTGESGVPSLSQRQLKTKISVVNGETVILTGFRRLSLANSESGLPGVGSLPGVGNWLFGSHENRQVLTEMLMALRFEFVLPKEVVPWQVSAG